MIVKSAIDKIKQIRDPLYDKFKCSRNPEQMHFVDTQITIANIGRDGNHLKTTGKDKLCSAMLRASTDFPKLASE